jgi:signal transduction histidine kinase
MDDAVYDEMMSTSASQSPLDLSRLAPVERALGLGRVIGLTVVASTATALALAGISLPRIVALGGIALVVFASLLLDRGRRAVSARRTMAIAVLVLLAQSGVIALTGGVRSPLLVVLIPISVAMVATQPIVGRRSSTLLLVAPLGAIWGLALGQSVAGWGAPPWIFDAASGPLGRWGHHLAIALSMTSVIVGLRVIVWGMRESLERALTQSQRMQRALLESTAERNREILDQSAAIAHELKNPLSAILSLSTLLARKAEKDSREEKHLAVMVAEAKRMREILDELLNSSRPLSPLLLQRERLAALTDDVLLMHETLAAERHLQISFDASPDVEIRCDRRKIKQVIINLLQNAIEVSPRGGRVHVRVRAEGDGAELCVHDEGPGLPAAARDGGLRAGFTTKLEGNGLGLSIVRAIVTQHGGAFSIGPKGSGPGCAAVVRLPVSPPIDTPRLESPPSGSTESAPSEEA